jgi:glucose/arabinose dehydrogenase
MPAMQHRACHAVVTYLPKSKLLLLAVGLLGLAGCGGGRAEIPAEDTVGPNPVLPAPATSLVPTVNVAKAIGWPTNGKPRAAEGLAVGAFACNLDHPRWLYVLPNGDVLVAETNAPPKPDDTGGIKGWFTSLFMERAGAGTASANRITLLRDTDGDGVADVTTPFIQGLNSSFGMALIGDRFYVANTDGIVRFDYQDGATELKGPMTRVADLPGGPINHHWTKNIIASPDGKRLFATIGSNSNAGENGIENERDRAAILEIDLATGALRLYASGLRNPVGLAWDKQSGKLWTVVNERDELGNDLVPDYLTSVTAGAFYGWPYSYWGQHIDARVEPQNPDLVAKAIKPDYSLGNHVAPLGLALSEGALLPERFRSGAFIGQHGSWNREPRAGYNVVFVQFADGMPVGKPIEVLSGFVNKDGEAMGRPVGIAFDKTGALLVADDVGNCVWRVTPNQ